ncbi:MAG: P27 family phage terminase small subunit [Propionibacteriaceae bacterium]|nr:P27 family phage terminase small subunit [Propionibacteriaceae bacterium]
MAAPVPRPPKLRIVGGRGTRKDGLETDSGGRPVLPGPEFQRQAPPKPAHLSPDASWLWDQVVEQMTAGGLLKPLDGASLEVACETWARWREAVRTRQAVAAQGKNGLLGRNSQGTVAAPWIGIEERASKDFRAWAAEFGLTPSAENHLPSGPLSGAAPASGNGNPF